MEFAKREEGAEDLGEKAGHSPRGGSRKENSKGL